MARPREPLVERFLEKVSIAENGCLEWGAYRDPDGYGRFWFDGKHRRAHRVAYALFAAPVPDELLLHHVCRNRGCVNPAHLKIVTNAENQAARRTCDCGRCITCRRRDYMRRWSHGWTRRRAG